MGAKRTSVGAASPAKKARQQVASQIKTVVEALTDEELPSEVPMVARQMLAKGAQSALCSAVEERHELQDKVLGHIREALSDISSRLMSAKDTVQSEAANEASAMEEARAALVAEEEALAEAQKAVDVQSEKLAEGKQALAAAEGELRVASQGVKASQRATDSIEKEKTRFTSLPERSEWKVLLAGECESDKERAKLIKTIVAQFQRIGAEEALLASAPAALSKKPEDRKGFDAMVIDSLTGLLSQGVEASDARLKEVAAEREKLDAEAVAKTEAVDKARATKDELAEELSKLQAIRDERFSAKATCDAKIAEGSAAAETRNARCADAEQRLAEFAEVLQCAESLATRSLAPLPEPEPEAPTGSGPAAEAVPAAPEVAA